jgi:ArsR family transcriptional regulator, arsenate/arsenite/antimonite-responsive transcriptional repressor
VDRSRVLDALSALSSEIRLDLVRSLIDVGDPGMAQGDIARRLSISASRLSFHLAALEQAGLVTARRTGRNMIYAADHAVIGGVIGYLLHDCCAGHPKVCACSQRRQAALPDMHLHP